MIWDQKGVLSQANLFDVSGKETERERSINFINNITLDYKQQQRVVDVVSKTNVFIDDKWQSQIIFHSERDLYAYKTWVYIRIYEGFIED